jgi:hypothetical protein
VALLWRAACPLRFADLAAQLLGPEASGPDLAALKSELLALAERGALTLARSPGGASGDLLCWVPGDPLRLAASAPRYSWPAPPPTPRTEVFARPGPTPPRLTRPETPRHVWTLHHNVAAGGTAVLAVRRRVLADGPSLSMELPGGAVALVSARELALRGSARTFRPAGDRAFHPLLVVYAHRPSDEERAAFLLCRAREPLALRAAPSPAWLIVPGSPGGPDRPLRCPTRRAPGDRRGEGTSRADVELRLPFRGYRDAPVVSALDLWATGLARFQHRRASFLVCAAEPLPLLLAQTAAERRASGEEAAFREAAAELLAPPRTASITDGEGALRELGLAPPCSVHEVGRAFRKRVKEERAHPDQGGSDEEFHELMRLRALAMGHVERDAPARSGA